MCATKTLSLLGVVLVIGLVGGPAAQAATVSVVNKTTTERSGYQRLRSVVTYTAAAGERNDLTLTAGPQELGPSDEATFEVRDPGATIQPRSGCTRVDANHARCNLNKTRSCRECDVDVWALGARVFLGDQADRFRAVVEGGGRVPSPNLLDGGPGADVIQGVADAFDTIVEGDIRGAPARDQIDGGGGGTADVVSYAGRSRGVRVDIGAGTGGAGGKEDVFKNVTGATGGRGNDVLIGNSAANVLLGGSGNDRLVGIRGNDRLTGGSGRDALSGGAGRDALFSRDRARDRVNGGSGRDSGRADRRDRVSSVEKLRRR
jgi:Ca2+-binding RTX toxin-like protein